MKFINPRQVINKIISPSRFELGIFVPKLKDPVWGLAGALIIFISIFAGVGNAEAKKIGYKGEKWLKVDVARLYHQPKKYVYKNVYFEINYVVVGHEWEKPSKNHFCFYVCGSNDKTGIYLWVKKNKKSILNVLYNLKNFEEEAKVFARIRRKKNWHGEYKYFVIAKYIHQTKN